MEICYIMFMPFLLRKVMFLVRMQTYMLFNRSTPRTFLDSFASAFFLSSVLPKFRC